MHSIGKIDIEIYKCVTNDITADEVIVTDTQIAHIKERINRIQHLFSSVSRITKKYQVILQLKTSSDPENYKNSVITFLKVAEKRYSRYLSTKKYF